MPDLSPVVGLDDDWRGKRFHDRGSTGAFDTNDPVTMKAAVSWGYVAWQARNYCYWRCKVDVEITLFDKDIARWLLVHRTDALALAVLATDSSLRQPNRRIHYAHTH